ncbi:TPA: conjugal transfer protein TrbM [Escherichia coli]|nr:conjugal transfer protein TrbM [Escherichia coli]
MRKVISALLVASASIASLPAQAQEFTGDVRLACEAILCLSTGQRPGECSPSLSRYFGIHKKKLSDTIKARHNFLNLCPDDQGQMSELKSAIANGAGRCDAAALNSQLMYWQYGDERRVIRDTMPGYCSTYASNSSVDQTNSVAARYVGTPERGGFWVDYDKYDTALAEYNARIAKEDANGGPNGGRWNRFNNDGGN